MDPKHETLYELASREMERIIKIYLQLAKDSKNFSQVEQNQLKTVEARRLLLVGLGSADDANAATPKAAAEEWKRRQAIPFDIEGGVTVGVYLSLREKASAMYDELEKATKKFKVFDSAYIAKNPHVLPLLQHVGGLFSKAHLRKEIGAVNDSSVSVPAAERLANLMRARVAGRSIKKGEILKRLDSTLEGIVRDLVGRVLLESVVANALELEGLPFEREDDYASLSGVVYDFRSDFVLPDHKSPKVFIEVRKSSTRHASLYAKDKMFSAINWKGKHKALLGVLVVEGPWTQATLQVMAKVFDYIVPLGKSVDLAKIVKAYLSGDLSKLKWLIEFHIDANNAG